MDEAKEAITQNDRVVLYPAFAENNVAITLAASAEYAPYMAVTIQSVIMAGTSSYNYDFVLLHSDIPEPIQCTICAMADGHPNVSIRFFNIAEQTKSYSFNFRSGYTAESFYRIMMIELLKEYEKIIYLDCDVIALTDLSELYKIDISNYLVAAARDIDGISNWYFNHDGRRDYMSNVMGLKDCGEYFQSGVMLFNLTQWRSTYSIEQILDVACADYIVWGDQDVLNILCKGKVKYLDMKWNTIVDVQDQVNDLFIYGRPELLDAYFEARRAPKIVHYGGSKPWRQFQVDMFPYFWKAARSSPFYDLIFERTVEYNLQKLGAPEIEYRSNIRRLADRLMPKGTRRREFLKRLLPKGSRRWNCLKKIFGFIIK